MSYHELRTRLAGNYRFIDLHIDMPKDLSVENAHKYFDTIEEKFTKKMRI